MAVYLFTFHAYRSWKPNNPRGFVKEGRGLQAPSEKLAGFYDREADQPEVRFGAFSQRVLVWILFDACSRRRWRLHYVATDPTHVHVLVSWRLFQPWQQVRKRLKTLSALVLGQKHGRAGRKWFSRKGSRKRVRDRRHLDYLVDEYLPGHRGLKWREGDPAPEEPPTRSSGTEPPASAGG